MTLTMLWPSGRHSERFEPSFIAFHHEISEIKKTSIVALLNPETSGRKFCDNNGRHNVSIRVIQKKNLLFLNAEHMNEWRISLLKGLQIDCAPLILEFSI